MRSKKSNSISKITRYLPVLIILLSITIIVGSTFAYFTDRKEDTSNLTFSKVELSSETTTGVNGTIRDVIPGTKLVDGALEFSKAIDSEAIYVRAKISFSLPKEYANDEDMKTLLDNLRGSTDFNIVATEQNGAVWSAKDGNYFYLLNADDATKLMRVDTIDTYVLSNEVVVPRDLEQLEDNAQYMKSINFHIAFEAIQADNVSDTLADTKQVFDAIFPLSVEEDKFAPQVKVTFMNVDKTTVFDIVKVDNGQLLIEPTTKPNEQIARTIFQGWFTDEEFVNEFDFNSPIVEDVVLYPKIVIGDTLTIMNEDGSSILTEVVVLDGENTVEPSIGDNYLDENGTSTKVVVGYYTDSSYRNEFKFGTVITQSYIIYPKLMNVSSNLSFTGLNEVVASSEFMMNNSPSFYSSSESSGFTSYSVSRGSCSSSIIVLPEYYFGKPVTQIATKGFNGGTFTNIYLPNTITTIKDSAFYGRTNLKEIVIPSSVTIIESNAFYNCTGVTKMVFNANVVSNTSPFYYVGNTANSELIIGADVTGLPKSMFYRTGFKKVTFEENSQCKSLGEYLFNENTSLNEIEIPASVETIGNNPFRQCTSLTNLTVNEGNEKFYMDGNCLIQKTGMIVKSGFVDSVIPEDVLKIGDYAFAYMKIVNVVIPNSVKTIESSAFYQCNKMTDLTIGEGVTGIRTYAFYECTSLKIINYNAKSAYLSTVNYGTSNNFIFYKVGSSATVNIGENVESLPNYLFKPLDNDYYNPSIKIINYNAKSVSDFTQQHNYIFRSTTDFTIHIGNEVERLPKYLFAYTPFTSITFAENSNCIELGDSVFLGSSKFTSITLPDSLTTIGEYAFKDCTALASANIPENVTTLGSGVFGGCKKLNTINYNAKSISDFTNANTIFGNAGSSTSAQTINIGENVKKLPKYIFSSAKYATMLNYNAINASDLVGGNHVFSDLGLSSSGVTVNIGANVNHIPNYLFYPNYNSNQPNIISVSFAENSSCSSIGDGAFMYCLAITNLTIFNSVESIGNLAFYGCSLLESIIFEEESKCTNIGNSAFGSNPVITTLTIPSSVTTIGTNPVRACPNLVLSVDSNNTNYYIENNCLIEASTKTLKSALSNASIPNDVLVIGGYAFDESDITSVTIPSGVTSIEKYAFYNCKNITEIIYNAKNVADFEQFNYVFYNIGQSSAGFTVTIGEDVERFPSYLFSPIPYASSSPNITKVIYNAKNLADITTSGLAFIGLGYNNGVDIVIGENVERIPNYLFYNATKILSVTFTGDKCTEIGSYVFDSCDDLQSVILPNSITTIGSYAFRGTSKYILVTNSTIAQLVRNAGTVNIYVLDSTTDFTSMTFTDVADGGVVNGSYSSWVRIGIEGSYTYYKKYTA